VKRISGTQQFGDGPWDWIGMDIRDGNVAADESGEQFMIFQMEVGNFPGWHVIYLRNMKDIFGKFSGSLIRATGPIILALSFLVGLSVFILYRKASHDIVRRRRAEEALRKAEEELRHYSKDLERQVRERTQEITSILRYTPAVVYIKDREGHYTFVNSRYEELFGVRNEDIGGKKDADIFPGEFADQFGQNDRMVLTEGKPLQVEERVPQKDGIHTYLSVKFPLYDDRGAVLGVCGISTDITEIKRAQDQLRRLSDSILEGQEKERAAVSRELHDELGQVLTALRMDSVWLREQLKSVDLAASERSGAMCDLIDRAIDEVRSMATRLRPGVLDDLGLIDALDWHTTDFEKRTHITCNFHHQHLPEVSESVATAAYRIAQETLTNVARHASATAVTVTLGSRDGALTLSVTDNGRGFDSRELDETEGLGAAGMRERASLVGGTLEIISGPGEGTRVTFRAPIRGKSEVLH
jgi:PAS domain S-box-containing protein